ncbi:hypothetical protein G6F68_018385 [Rhizopus microsporus]|nr:hypothetical protein G6F68_018385 [Rhizopus microsporus]
MQEGVAVGGAGQHAARAQHPRATAHVLDDDLLLERMGDVHAELPRRGIAGAAGRIRHDQAQGRVAGVGRGLRQRGGGAGRQANGGRPGR